MEKRKSIGAVIFRKEKNKIYYLLLHYPAGHWDFPKGHLKKGETEKETALREIKEETGLEEIEFIPNFSEKITYFFRDKYNHKKKSPLIFKEVIFYLTQSKEKNIKISFEHLGYEWLPFEEAIKKITFKNSKRVLKKAHYFLTKN